MKILDVKNHHQRDFYRLNYEYLDWATRRLKQEYGIEFVPFDEQYTEAIAKYASDSVEEYLHIGSEGHVAVLSENGTVFGMGLLKKLKEEVSEIKRMYIQPTFRGNGYGKHLLEHLIDRAYEKEYRVIMLDSVKFMSTAHHLYQSHGFEFCDPYPESEIAEELQKHWIFMKKIL